MGGTYAGAYSDGRYPSSSVVTKKTLETYKVLESELIDSYHYHGSWFEYTWKLKLLDSNGDIVEKELDTWRGYPKLKNLNGKVITYNGITFEIEGA